MKSTKPLATEKRPNPAATKIDYAGQLFGKENYTWMLIGVAVLIIGFLLMAGGGNADPAVFDKSEVYSARRITLAPIIILLGIAIEIYAIFSSAKKQQHS